MAKFKPSKYQKAIYKFVKEGTGNAVINAVAGSGKTSTLLAVLKEIPQDAKVLFLAFNKSIVEELRIKVGNQPNVEISTLHSLGCRALMRQFRTNIESNKYSHYVRDGLKYGSLAPTHTLSPERMDEYRGNIRKLLDIARVNLLTAENCLAALNDLAYHHDIFLLDNELDIVQRALRWGTSNIGQIDFTDMIYLPNVLDVTMPQYDWVLIDECQDLNAAQREMFLKCVKPTGRFIAVGDPKQAIYGFAGADVASFNILKSLPNTVELPLSVCYRCDTAMIALAKTIVPQIEARKDAPEGTYNAEAKVSDLEDGDMVLCRNSAPLASLCMHLLGGGTKAYIKGKDIGANLIKMLDTTRKTNLVEAIVVMERELEKVLEKVCRKEHCGPEEGRQSAAYTAYKDKIQAIEVLGEGLTQVRQVVSRIESIFSDSDRAGICLSTIHKAKGLEANRVFILCPDKLYNKRCMCVAWMAEQEANLVYVLYTRAKHYLGVITDYTA